MPYIAEPIQEIKPHPDCPGCGGEGVQTPESQMFDYDNAPPCAECLRLYAAEDESTTT